MEQLMRFIDKLIIKNYGCLKDADIDITPLHAFFGPNDTGKSTLLRAIETLVLLMGDITVEAQEDAERLYEELDDEPGEEESRVLLAQNKHFFWGFSKERGHRVQSFVSQGQAGLDLQRALGKTKTKTKSTTVPNDASAYAQLPAGTPGEETLPRRVFLARFDPDVLREPSELVPGAGPLSFKSEKGLGLAGIYDAVRDRDVDDFTAIRDRVCRLFPSVRKLQLCAVDTGSKVIQTRLVSGETVRAKRMSDGILYYLGFAALPHIDPVSVLLVEEPERGLHPQMISEVVGLLRELSRRCQVIISTRSPLVAYELSSEEVTLLTRTTKGGTTATAMKDAVVADEESKLEALMAFANGVTAEDDEDVTA